MNAMDRMKLHEAEDWCRWDADSLVNRARLIRQFIWQHDRLPIPVGFEVREAYRVLGQVIEKLDEKKESEAA